MSTNPKSIYNEFIRANLPSGIDYDEARAQYVTFNGKRFPTYLQAKWYVDYLDKLGLFDPLRLFTKDEAGVWYDPSDRTTLFQDTAGTTPVTTSGQTVGLTLDKSGNDLDATQATAAARPSYIVDADGTFIQHDLIDDALTVTLPDMGAEATVAYVTRSEVRLLEDQTISGSYTLPTQEIAGFVAIDRALTIVEKVKLIQYLASKVEGVNYGAEIDRLTLIAINAVDVFVYDTSKDSDGGAWRTGALAQASSWYNETLNTTTRGSRREFPAVAVIVAETDKVTIYDGDDPALPMWMVFDQIQAENYFRLGGGVYAITGLSVLNGTLSVSFYGASGYRNSLTVVNFPADKGANYSSSQSKTFNGTISQRNAANSGLGETIFNTLIVTYVVNDVAMTVLPDAPIDAATGLPVPTIAVATEGGVSVIKDDGVVVDSGSTLATNVCSFDATYGLWWSRNQSSYLLNYAAQIDYEAGDGFGDVVAASVDGYNFDVLTIGQELAITPDAIYAGGSSTVNRSVAGLEVILPNYTDQSKGMSALLTSTYNTGWMNGSIKGAFLSDTDDTDLVGGVNQVTNGTFDTDANWSKGTGWTIGSGVASCDGTQTGNTTLTQQGTISGANLNFEVGKAYVLTFDVTVSAGFIAQVEIGGAYDTTDITSSGTYTKVITASSTNDRLGFTANIDFVGTIDNVTVTDGDADRSVNANGLVVTGNITRSPVATGADLVAYSGFSASNYLEGNDTSYVDTLYAIGWEQTSGVWGFKHGVVSTAPIDGLTITTNTLKIQGTKPKALIRLSATTPSAAQLEKIENDEKVLFQENAQATLYGASDAVTALAHDPDTDLLHVGTSAGRSVFEGLRRVGNTTTSVSASISASGGLIVEK